MSFLRSTGRKIYEGDSSYRGERKKREEENKGTKILLIKLKNKREREEDDDVTGEEGFQKIVY